MKSMKSIKQIGILVFIGMFLLTSCQPSDGQNTGIDNSEKQILEQQSNRFAAMVDANLINLESLLADDLTYGHTGGHTETKLGFIETVKSKRIDYVSFIPGDVDVRVYGKTAVLTGFIDVRAIYKNEEIVMTTRFLEVQRKVDGNWLLEAWQPVRYVTE